MPRTPNVSYDSAAMISLANELSESSDLLRELAKEMKEVIGSKAIALPFTVTIHQGIEAVNQLVIETKGKLSRIKAEDELAKRTNPGRPVSLIPRRVVTTNKKK
jgi:hypothetical protein